MAFSARWENFVVAKKPFGFLRRECLNCSTLHFPRLTILLYNLDAIIAVGYRMNSYEATQFRIWAREVLKEYIIKGFVMDDERLKGSRTSTN